MKIGSWLTMAGVLLGLAALTGCGMLDSLRGDLPTNELGADRETKFRPPAKNSEPFFFDERGRQIERNLGV